MKRIIVCLKCLYETRLFPQICLITFSFYLFLLFFYYKRGRGRDRTKFRFLSAKLPVGLFCYFTPSLPGLYNFWAEKCMRTQLHAVYFVGLQQIYCQYSCVLLKILSQANEGRRKKALMISDLALDWLFSSEVDWR